MSSSEIESPDGAPVVEVQDRASWRAWLQEHHASEPPRAWLVLRRKGSSEPGVSYENAVEEALAFGWIDSRGHRLDEQRTLLMFSRRKPGSGWARSNKNRVARLIDEGRMAPAGLAAVDAAKADGSWERLEAVQALVEPAELATALDANPEARRYFDAFPPSSKRIILEWIASARRPETRAARIAETVASAHDNVRANHYRQPKSGEHRG